MSPAPLGVKGGGASRGNTPGKGPGGKGLNELGGPEIQSWVHHGSWGQHYWSLGPGGMDVVGYGSRAIVTIVRSGDALSPIAALAA